MFRHLTLGCLSSAPFSFRRANPALVIGCCHAVTGMPPHCRGHCSGLPAALSRCSRQRRSRTVGSRRSSSHRREPTAAERILRGFVERFHMLIPKRNRVAAATLEMRRHLHVAVPDAFARISMDSESQTIASGLLDTTCAAPRGDVHSALKVLHELDAAHVGARTEDGFGFSSTEDGRGDALAMQPLMGEVVDMSISFKADGDDVFTVELHVAGEDDAALSQENSHFPAVNAPPPEQPSAIVNYVGEEVKHCLGRMQDEGEMQRRLPCPPPTDDDTLANTVNDAPLGHHHSSEVVPFEGRSNESNLPPLVYVELTQHCRYGVSERMLRREPFYYETVEESLLREMLDEQLPSDPLDIDDVAVPLYDVHTHPVQLDLSPHRSKSRHAPMKHHSDVASQHRRSTCDGFVSVGVRGTVICVAPTESGSAGEAAAGGKLEKPMRVMLLHGNDVDEVKRQANDVYFHMYLAYQSSVSQCTAKCQKK